MEEYRTDHQSIQVLADHHQTKQAGVLCWITASSALL